MSSRRLFDRPDRDAEPAERVEAPPVASAEAPGLLALQRSAGNAAVARMLAAPSVGVAREDGYTVEAPSDADFVDSLAGSESESDSETESESGSGDPGTELAHALAMRAADKGTAGQRPAIGSTRGYTTAGPAAEDDLSTDSERESTSSESETEDASVSESLSEDLSVSERAIDVAAQVLAEDASDSFSEVSADLASELSSDLSESADVSGDEAASASSSSSRASAPAAPAQAASPAAPPLPAVAATAPVAVKKSAAKRALKALAKPVRALKKIFKGKRKKDLPTKAQLLADDEVVDVSETGSAASASASTSGRSASKSRSRRSRRRSVSEHPDTASGDVTAMSTAEALAVSSTTSTSDAFSGVSADDESTSTQQPTAAPAAPAPADPNRAAPVKYATRDSLISVDEAISSENFMNEKLLSNMALLYDMGRFGLLKMISIEPPEFDVPEARAALRDRGRITEGLKKVWGWTDEDVQKYFVFERHRARDTKVTFIRDEADLKKYVVHPGATLTHDDPPRVFDTGGMVSKASGPGYAIFVMDPQGNIYAGQHRVGLFHHSSFTAGRAVAAAGEMKVTAGKLERLTSKSGHYAPSAEHTWQVVKRMADAGVSFAGAEVTLWIDVPGQDAITHYHDGEEFLRLGDKARITKIGGKFG